MKSFDLIGKLKDVDKERGGERRDSSLAERITSSLVNLISALVESYLRSYICRVVENWHKKHFIAEKLIEKAGNFALCSYFHSQHSSRAQLLTRKDVKHGRDESN